MDPPHLSRFTEEFWGHVQIGGWGPPGAGSWGCGWRQVRSQLVDGTHRVCGEGHSAERSGGCGGGRAGKGCGSGCGGRAERRGSGWAWKGRGYTRQGHPMLRALPWCAQAWGPWHSSIFPNVGGYAGPHWVWEISPGFSLLPRPSKASKSNKNSLECSLRSESNQREQARKGRWTATSCPHSTLTLVPITWPSPFPVQALVPYYVNEVGWGQAPQRPGAAQSWQRAAERANRDCRGTLTLNTGGSALLFH